MHTHHDKGVIPSHLSDFEPGALACVEQNQEISMAPTPRPRERWLEYQTTAVR